MSAKETADAILIVIKKIGKWIVVFAFTLLLIFLVLYAFKKIEDYYQNRPQIVISLKGIELEEKFQDFMFRNAGFVLDPVNSNKASELTYYDNKDKSMFVGISAGKVVRALYKCTDKYEYTNINGITCRSSGDSVFDKYDKVIRVQCLKDKSDINYLNYRIYNADNFGVRYHVFSNEVLAFEIAKPTDLTNLNGFMNKKWTACE
jgi:hypothetical protein